MISTSMFLLLIGCALVTWVPRILPFIFVRTMKLPAIVMRWLAYIPVCILSALVISNLFEKHDQLVVLNWPIFFAFLPTVLVAIWTKSLSITVIVGVVSMAAIRFLTL
ncbi:MAG: AzlD domain-containing protein [Kurthia sp.]|nr:AzlD domain-containing protein [Candidatus Kurthia equi]